MIGIVSYGAYLPVRRFQRSAMARANAWFNPALMGLAKGERTTAAWDEDAVTMAVEAARDCLQGRDRSSVRGIMLASTSLPFEDRQQAGILKEALSLADDIGTLDVGFSQRAGTSALLQALRTAQAGMATLCVASEKRRARPGSEQELSFGDGAAAVLAGGEDVIAEWVGVSNHSVDLVDHYRAAGHHEVTWEARWVRDELLGKVVPAALQAALAKLGLGGEQVQHFVCPVTLRSAAAGLAKAVGIPGAAVADVLAATVGDTGAAHPLLMLADVLGRAKPGDLIVLVGLGQGLDVLAFRATARIEAFQQRERLARCLARRQPDDNYLRYLTLAGHLDIDRGKRGDYASGPTLLSVVERNRRAILGLVGGRDPATGEVQFPKTGIPVSGRVESAGKLEDHPLADLPCTLVSFTRDALTFTPEPPALYGLVEFEGGGRLMAEFVDVGERELAVGMPMRMVFRIHHVDAARGYPSYFWKAAPVEPSTATA